MPPQTSPSTRRTLLAHIAPFLLFGICALFLGVHTFAGFSSPWWITHPEFWVFPLQTLVCGVAIIFYRNEYEWGPPRQLGLGLAAGLLVLAIWVAPQWLLGFAPRTEGFNPELASRVPGGESLTLVLRFIRLVVVVPIFEEIFWRSFLLRYLIKEDFSKLPLGTATRFSFLAVALLFMLAHRPEDYVAAFLTGLVFNGVMTYSKNLFACVLAHAVANLGLGIYIIQTKQWGFW